MYIHIHYLHIFIIKNIHNNLQLKFRKQQKKIHYCSRNKIISILIF